ncbi:MAG: DUF882 domain-containing protein [Polyangiaceae bacterium]|nr:DUF882 domain-containing protein [Polyangiaceae bacterium]
MVRPLLGACALFATTAVSSVAIGDGPKLPVLPPPSSPHAHAAAPAPAPSSKPKPAPRAASRAVKPSRAAQTIAAARIWHTPASGKTAPLDASGRPVLVLQGLNIHDRVELRAQSDRGDFSAEDLDRAAHILRDPHSGNEHPIDPRLLDLVYRVAVHFHAQEIRIISGYRTPHGGKVSNHGKGRAMDFVVPGATDEEVAKFAREQGFVGVGVYPTSGFVHLDVRERSFFWVDASGPGKKGRTRGILSDLAHQSDAEAVARGDHPVPPFAVGGDVDAALHMPVGVHAADDKQDDDDDFGLSEDTPD